MKRIIFVGGHSSPAFSVLDEFIEKDYELHWVSEKHNQRGGKNLSAEYITVVDKYKIPFWNIKTGKVIRYRSIRNTFNFIKEIFLIFYGFLDAIILILRIRPNIIVSFGGFLSVPLVIIGKLLFRVKVLSHEQTLTFGLANKVNAYFSDVSCISFEESKKYISGKKVILTGNPIRKDIFEYNFEILVNTDLPTIYITGGNQGANEINKRIFHLIPKLLDFANVIHQTGNSSSTNDFLTGKDLEKKYLLQNNGKYIVKDYIEKTQIGSVFKIANLIISRSGANTVTEILATGKMAILIPIPWVSQNEQYKNAELLSNLGLGKILIQNSSLSAETLFQSIIDGLNLEKQNLDFLGNNLENTKKLAKDKINLNASKEIFKEVLQLLD